MSSPTAFSLTTALRSNNAFESLKQDVCSDLVFTHYRQDLHQDHRVVSDLTWNTFRDHLILEYESPKYYGDFGSPSCSQRYPKRSASARSKLFCPVIGARAASAGSRAICSCRCCVCVVWRRIHRRAWPKVSTVESRCCKPRIDPCEVPTTGIRSQSIHPNSVRIGYNFKRLGNFVLNNNVAYDTVPGTLSLHSATGRKWRQRFRAPIFHRCRIGAHDLSDGFTLRPGHKKFRKRRIKDQQLHRAYGSCSPKGF